MYLFKENHKSVKISNISVVFMFARNFFAQITILTNPMPLPTRCFFTLLWKTYVFLWVFNRIQKNVKIFTFQQ